ncbi:peptidase M42, partial [Lacticaseibacillus rhamnosus]
MDLQLMAALSNADAIAANESEVRAVLRHHLAPYGLTSQTDGLGSLIFTKKPPIRSFQSLFMVHMDEVGY